MKYGAQSTAKAIGPLYPILDAEMAAAHGHDLVACARGLTGLGLRVQQLRAKTLSSRDFLALAERLAAVVPELVINDRADIARLAKAPGVHVGQTDLPASAVRQLQTPEWRIARLGVSTHNPGQLDLAIGEQPSYIALGPVFPTTSKADPDPVVGLAALGAARRQMPGTIPLVAIGGVGLHNCRAVREAGADSVAVISALWAQADPIAAARGLLLALA